MDALGFGDYQFHEAANIFPLLDSVELENLAEDIRTNGLVEPLKLCDGKIIDGRNRYKACLLAQVKPKFDEVSPSDPVAYVLSLNLHRRHLTPSQASMCAARARDIYERQAKERQGKRNDLVEKLPQCDSGKARDLAGKAFGVSGKSVDHASRVIEKGIPELAKAVDEGRIAVSTAAILATEPEEVQRAEVNNPNRNRKYKPVVGGSGTTEPKEKLKDEPVEGEVRGVGVRRAHDAIACLKRIPKADALRKRGFQIVSDYIKQNR
jgi:ParB-like chromosome segregation protein Spo0J